MTKPKIMSTKANWSTTWIVVRPNPSWDATKDPEGHNKYTSYHILFCAKASEQKFLNKSQIDALLKSTNTGAGGPAQRIDGERMLISWNGKTGWVAARTLKERAARAAADALPAHADAADPLHASGNKKAAPEHGASKNLKKQKVSDEYFWDASFFGLETPVRVGDVKQRRWKGVAFTTLVPGLARFKQEFLERMKPKSIKPVVEPKQVAPIKQHQATAEVTKPRGGGGIIGEDAKAAVSAVPYFPSGAAAASNGGGKSKSGVTHIEARKDNGLDGGAYADSRTHTQVVQRFVDYMSGDVRVPDDVRAFFQTHAAIMNQMVDKYGASSSASSTNVFGHMLKMSKLPPSDWNKANLEAFARTYGVGNRQHCLAVWQAQTGTFNQLFSAALAPKETVTIDDLY
jgi:hypothetical protein